MDLKAAEDTFAVRLYEWSLQDCERELVSDCPLLSMVGLNNRSVAGFVAWVRTLSTAERRSFANARVRYAHEHAARLKGEALTVAEVSQCNELFSHNVGVYREQMPPLASADWRLPTFQPVKPDSCLDVLVASISPVLGKPSRRGRSTIRCIRNFGDWKIITEFIFSRTDKDLRFEYQFVRKDGTPIMGHSQEPFPPHRTLFFFWGIWDTSVQVPSQLDSEPMAKLMAKLADYFVCQAEPLFAGLGMKDGELAPSALINT